MEPPFAGVALFIFQILMRKSKTRKPRSVLTRNVAAVESALSHLSFNASTKGIRRDTMEGEEYVIVKMVMLTEGVHSGSAGAVFYPKEELKKTPQSWNHKPVVVYHPEINGEGVSACDPDILTTHKIGVIMNTRFDKLGRLTAEAWLREDRVKKVDDRVWEAIEKGEMMELSTGLFTDNEVKTGETDEGETYEAIARNYRPDHLAVLPDQKGACSIEDGAGFLRNSKKNKAKEIQIAINELSKLVVNDLSFDSIRCELSEAVCQKLTGMEPSDIRDYMACPWVMDCYANYFIYSYGGKLFKLGYSVSGDEVELSGDPQEVERKTEYVTMTAEPVATNNVSETTTKMDKASIINALIANGKYAEEDRADLLKLNLSTLQKMLPPQAAPSTNKETPPAPVKPSFATVEDFIAAAPVAFRDVLTNSLDSHKEEKNRLIAVITANKTNVFTPEQLESLPIGQLRGIAALAGQSTATTNSKPAKKQADFSGNGDVAPVVNTDNQEDVIEPLIMPVMNWDSK